MEQIVKKAGYTLSQSLEIIARTKILSPFLVGYTSDNKEVKINSKDMILELSIPKIVNSYELNSNNLVSACIVFPAEIGVPNGPRETSLVAMAQRYDTYEQVVISQPYHIENGELEILEFELFEYSPNLEDKLTILEASFLQGILEYEGVENIWSRGFKAS